MSVCVLIFWHGIQFNLRAFICIRWKCVPIKVVALILICMAIDFIYIWTVGLESIYTVVVVAVASVVVCNFDISFYYALNCPCFHRCSIFQHRLIIMNRVKLKQFIYVNLWQMANVRPLPSRTTINIVWYIFFRFWKIYFRCYFIFFSIKLLTNMKHKVHINSFRVIGKRCKTIGLVSFEHSINWHDNLVHEYVALIYSTTHIDGVYFSHSLFVFFVYLVCLFYFEKTDRFQWTNRVFLFSHSLSLSSWKFLVRNTVTIDHLIKCRVWRTVQKANWSENDLEHVNHAWHLAWIKSMVLFFYFTVLRHTRALIRLFHHHLSLFMRVCWKLRWKILSFVFVFSFFFIYRFHWLYRGINTLNLFNIYSLYFLFNFFYPALWPPLPFLLLLLFFRLNVLNSIEFRISLVFHSNLFSSGGILISVVRFKLNTTNRSRFFFDSLSHSFFSFTRAVAYMLLTKNWPIRVFAADK